jgi:Uma2 family endonuclease
MAHSSGDLLADRQRNAHLRRMSSALKLPSRRMTVAEFLDSDSGDRGSALWQLRDGEPERMAPASDPHGSIQARLAQLLGVHLDARGSQCRVVIAPGVIPSERSEINCLIPDLGVTDAPPGAPLMLKPLLLIEILSPSNASKTRANVRAYRTIPGVQEIVVLRSAAISAEILRRGPDGAWPRQPEHVGADGTLRLDSIGFAAPLRDAYRTTGLV